MYMKVMYQAPAGKTPSVPVAGVRLLDDMVLQCRKTGFRLVLAPSASTIYLGYGNNPPPLQGRPNLDISRVDVHEISRLTVVL